MTEWSRLKTEAYGITFEGEASDPFAHLIDRMIGYVVFVTPEDDEAEEFDAVLVGRDSASEWVDSILVRLWSVEKDGPIGPPFSIRIRNVHVY